MIRLWCSHCRTYSQSDAQVQLDLFLLSIRCGWDRKPVTHCDYPMTSVSSEVIAHLRTASGAGNAGSPGA